MEKIDLDLLMEEFKQAWEHYRHLEKARTQYINFFLTAALASAGFITSLFKNLKPESVEKALIGALIVIWVFNLLLLFVYVNVKKIGFVLKYYEEVMSRIRKL